MSYRVVLALGTSRARAEQVRAALLSFMPVTELQRYEKRWTFWVEPPPGRYHLPWAQMGFKEVERIEAEVYL